VRPIPLPALVVALVALGACSQAPVASRSPSEAVSTSPPAPSSSTPTSEAPSDPSTGASTEGSPEPGAPQPPLTEAAAAWEVVGEGYEGPVQVLPAPDGRILVVEQVGRLRTLGAAEVVLDLTDRVTVGGERGLLGATFHPDRDRLFVHYSGTDGRTVVSSFPVEDGAVDAGDESILFEHAQPASNHNGGALLFDPDGRLVLALGDGGGAGDRFGNGQDPGTDLGALLRFDADGPTLVPAPDNPFVDGGGAPTVWAYGLRNPWRVAFDDERLYVADVGQDAVEEVSVVARDEVAGANFGWPILEGTTCYRSADCDPSGTVRPVAELRHADGACSIIGGVVVPEGHPTGLGGAYLYSDLCDTTLRALRVADGDVESAAIGGAQVPDAPLGFGVGPDGQVWVGTRSGRVLELVPA
jgi:glucose/arabinose dehydrogenase